jgi:hypothetical protein
LSRNDSTESYLYFAQSEHGGPVKIGISVNPLRRIEHFQAASANGRIALIGALPGRDRFDEAVVHHYFAPQRLHGEWFEPVEQIFDIAAGRWWPDEIALPRMPAASGVPNPNTVRMPMSVWRSREAIQTCADSGMTVDAIARMMRWDLERLLREVSAMRKLGYFRGVDLEQRYGGGSSGFEASHTFAHAF